MRRVALVLVFALVAACTGGDDDSDAKRSTTPTAATPELVPTTCPFKPPPEHQWECSTLIVPTDRRRPSGPHVLLPVAVLRTKAADPLPDPIVYFNGGPGDDTLLSVPGYFEDLASSGRRDVVLFDQRGTGGARPSLDCPEAEAAMRINLSAADAVDIEVGRESNALEVCRARLARAGVDLDAFDTPTTADDAEDLRRALGVKLWNVIGQSYGTTVALEVARRHPESVRSVILDSVFPPDITQRGTQTVTATARSFQTLFDGCAGVPTCASSHPDLHAEFNALAADWDAHPFELDVQDPANGETLHVVLNGADLAGGLRQALYDSSLIPVLPSVSSAIRTRDDASRSLVATFVVRALDNGARVAEADNGIVNCADRQRLAIAQADVAPLLAATPSLRAFEFTFDECSIWDVAPAPKAFNTIPRSQLPLLALAGEYDPTTPPADTERAAARFTGSTYVLFPGLGHAELFGHECARTITKAFIDDPSTTPDESCVAKLGPPAFAPG